MTRLHREFPAKAESLYWRAPRTTVRGHVRPIFLESPTMKHAMPFVARLPLSLGLAAALLAGCAAPRPESGPADVAVPLVILDTDVGSSTDDLFALEMLYRYEDAGKCRLLGVVVDRPGEANAAFVDAMNAWAGRPELPVGLVRRGPADAKVFIDYARVADATDAAGRPLFPRTAPGDRPDGAALYRRLLADAPDGSVTVCSIGFLTALAQLLESPPDGLSPLDGAELVRRKVARAVMMGGAFADGAEPEYNFAMDPESARTFFRLWPRDVEIVFSPAEVGDAIDYPPALVVSDLDWTDRHPIKQVYLQCDCDTGQRMWDALAAVQAVEGDAAFSLGGRGTVELSPDGRTAFVPSPSGNCRRQLPGSPAWNAAMLEKIRAFNQAR